MLEEFNSLFSGLEGYQLLLKIVLLLLLVMLAQWLTGRWMHRFAASEEKLDLALLQ